jgi:2-C-methyl-D-erythritol 4-phosphate cytidylyltransferase
MGSEGNKLFLELGGSPVLAHALRPFVENTEITEIIIPVAPADEPQVRALLRESGIAKARVIRGGAERQESVLLALAALPPGTERVVIHDGARPLLTTGQLREFLLAAATFPAAITAVPVIDTIKEIAPDCSVVRTLPRSALCAVQTPQVFAGALLQKAHSAARTEGVTGTDDAYLVERLGVAVHVLPGWPENIKITTPVDFALAQILLQE